MSSRRTPKGPGRRTATRSWLNPRETPPGVILATGIRLGDAGQRDAAQREVKDLLRIEVTQSAVVLDLDRRLAKLRRWVIGLRDGCQNHRGNLSWSRVASLTMRTSVCVLGAKLRLGSSWFSTTRRANDRFGGVAGRWRY